MSHSTTTRLGADRVGPAQIALVLGDLVVFLFFAFEGRATHGLPFGPWPILTVLAVAAPFAVPWFLLAWLWGIFQASVLHHPVQMVLRTAIAWLSAGSMGLVLRTLLLDRPLDPDFAAAALGIVAAMLLAWRLVASLIAARTSPAP